MREHGAFENIQTHTCTLLSSCKVVIMCFVVANTIRSSKSTKLPVCVCHVCLCTVDAFGWNSVRREQRCTKREQYNAKKLQLKCIKVNYLCNQRSVSKLILIMFLVYDGEKRCKCWQST